MALIRIGIWTLAISLVLLGLRMTDATVFIAPWVRAACLAGFGLSGIVLSAAVAWAHSVALRRWISSFAPRNVLSDPTELVVSPSYIRRV